MAWIQPNSTVKILKDVPLDNNYENTLYYAGTSAQASDLATYAKYTFTAKPSTMMYQRVNKNTIRIEKKADLLYDCNYMMFQNTEYGTKWFYAFITQVNYVNDNVSEVVYEIDVIQTWIIEITNNLEQCFIERQHADYLMTDAVGANLQPEDLSIGEYKLSPFTQPTQFGRTNSVIVMALAIDYDSATNIIPTSAANCYRSVFTGCEYHVYPNSAAGAALLKQDLSYLTAQVPSKIDYVMNIFIAPKYLTYPRVQDSGHDTNVMASSDSIPQEEYKVTKQTSGTIDGYTPKNNKLFTYPYNFLYVTNYQGVGKPFPYEYFNTPYNQSAGYALTDCVFELGGDINGSPTAMIYPLYYKGANNNYDEAISCNGYPQCAWNADTYKAWIAQAKGLGALALGLGAAAAGFGALGVMGAGYAANEYMQANYIPSSGTDLMTRTQWNYPNPPKSNAAIDAANAGLGAVKSLGTKAVLPLTLLCLKRGFSAFVNPIEQRGNQSGSALLPDSMLGFGFYNKHITSQYAERIDMFFNMYGYAQNIVKKPNIHARTEYTYIKTVGCAMKGGAPVDDIEKICAIFDNGIRFWTNKTNVGNYTVTNSIYTPPTNSSAPNTSPTPVVTP